MVELYRNQLLMVFILAIMAEGVHSSISRLNKRITNLEVKLDTINNDIATFRLDILDVFDRMDEMNNTVCQRENSDHNMDSRKTERQPIEEGDDQVSETMFYHALQSEKKFVRKQIKENVNALEHKLKHVEALMDDQAVNIKKVAQNIKTVNNTCVFKKEQEDTNAKFVQDMNTIDNKVTDLKRLQQNTLENMTQQADSTKTATEDIDQLKQEVKTYKEALDRALNQITALQLGFDQLKTACLPHWHSSGMSCLYFSALKQTWSDAKRACESKDSYLVEYKNRQEVEAVAELAKSLSAHSNRYWVGASEAFIEGLWIWTESEKIILFDNWKKNQQHYHDYNDNCLSTHIDENGHWNVLDCNTKITYICQRAK